MSSHKIIDLPESERPRERLKKLGAGALSSEELLAVLIGSGSRKKPILKLARELLIRFKSLHGLGQASLEELQGVSGIGPSKALQLKAAFTLADKCYKEKLAEIEEVKCPNQAFNIAVPYIRDEKREHFLILLLNVKMRLIGVEVISIGTLSATLVHPREVLYQAIRRKASSIIAIHNHPSGDLTPSKEDLSMTQNLIQASAIIDIPLIDHLIISTCGYFSMREHGISFYQSTNRMPYVFTSSSRPFANARCGS